jgi:hypothetical protein
MARGIRIHQGSLGKAHEGSGGRVEDDEGGKQQKKLPAKRGEEQRQTVDDTTAEYKYSTPPDITQDAKERFYNAADNIRQPEQDTDLGIVKGQVVTYQRPGGLADAEYELIEELDKQQS